MIHKPSLTYNVNKVVELVNYRDFGENLRQLRRARSLTQRDLGAKVGLSKAVVSKYETGMGYPSFDVLIRIARYFGVTTDYLLGATGSKTVDVSGLTDSQTDMVLRLIAEFRKDNQYPGENA